MSPYKQWGSGAKKSVMIFTGKHSSPRFLDCGAVHCPFNARYRLFLFFYKTITNIF
ncbi:hypothetical protein SAMN06295960_2674 [Paenibacillus aquistagni]|uniref:Uncharacterized protein n=1 Tax=Paenibacillus aquistagni TaxID=1852522 RepID=A0A1X7KSN4_9BACL|nr:hypothetical protein SAMN06295960_2674 [Paenibacillus aquistagni]